MNLMFICCLFFNSLIVSSKATGSIEIEFSGIESQKGHLYIAIFDNAEAFPRDEMYAIRRLVIAPTEKIRIDELDFGNYAIAAFHDANGNGKLDKNIIGVPIEPFAFSNNLKPKWRRPTFSEAVVELNQDPLLVELIFCKWRDL